MSEDTVAHTNKEILLLIRNEVPQRVNPWTKLKFILLSKKKKILNYSKPKNLELFKTLYIMNS